MSNINYEENELEQELELEEQDIQQFNSNKSNDYNNPFSFNSSSSSSCNNKKQNKKQYQKENNRDNNKSNTKDNKKQSLNALSHTLSSILRHRAVELKIPISPAGYVSVSILLKHPMIAKFDVTMKDIQKIVEENNKKRFGLVENEKGEWMIRAVQGHTMKQVNSDLLLTPLTLELAESSYPYCIHGTYLSVWNSHIKKEGLAPMDRNHIHFSSQPFGSSETISGMRSNVNVLIHIDLVAALKAGIPFYLSENKVILCGGESEECEFLRPKWFKRVEQLEKGKVIAELEWEKEQD